MSSSPRNLSLEDRIKLVEDLWDSIAAEQGLLPLSPAQQAELDRRIDAYELSKDSGRLAVEVIKEIRGRL